MNTKYNEQKCRRRLRYLFANNQLFDKILNVYLGNISIDDLFEGVNEE